MYIDPGMIVITSGFPVDMDQWVNAFFILIGAWIVSSFSYTLLVTYGTIIAAKTIRNSITGCYRCSRLPPST